MYLITTPAVFLNQTHLVRLGIFHLELGKKTYFLALGMGPNFDPKFHVCLWIPDICSCSYMFRIVNIESGSFLSYSRSVRSFWP